MDRAIWAYPDVGRAGLGNMLFPWARAEVFAHRHRVPILAPQWTQPKIGPLLRGERDLRYYVGLFDNARGGYVRGLRRALVLARSARVEQGDAEAFMASGGGGAGGRASGRYVVTFAGWKGWFEGLLDHRELIARRLTQILAPRVQEILARAPRDYEIAVHVRRGDKTPAAFGAPYSGDSTFTMADEWYVRAIEAARAAMGREAPVKVFSDAPRERLSAILRVPGVSLSDPSPSIVDIFCLSRARVLITSGGSSFSAWASFLGAMPTIWYPGTGMALIPARPGLSIESTLEGTLPPEGVERLRSHDRERTDDH